MCDREEWISSAYDVYDGYTTRERLGAIYDAGLAARAQGGEAVATINEARCFSVDDANRIMRLPPGTKLYTHPSASVPEGGDPVAWMNQRGEVITDEQKQRLTSNQGIVGAATATNFSIPLVAMEVNNVLR